MNATDKTAVVTGGSAGIGRAAAIALLKDGWSVAIGGRRGDALDETLALAGDDGARGLSVPGDLSMPEGCANLFAKTRERFGQVDLAGRGEHQPVEFFLLHAGSLPRLQGARPDGRADHQ
jgi:NAD(P)-dependent dehydrogenase (short-subunit alcohol dehydrogenase family)